MFLEDIENEFNAELGEHATEITKTAKKFIVKALKGADVYLSFNGDIEIIIDDEIDISHNIVDLVKEKSRPEIADLDFSESILGALKESVKWLEDAINKEKEKH